MFSLTGAGKVLDLRVPRVMGILNCTPDSFYSVSRVQQLDQGLRFAEEQIRQGASILDLGGQSTRPGSSPVPPDEETERVIPLLTKIRKEFPEIFLSIDTFHAPVAKAAVDAGVDMINDISAGQIDPLMLKVASESKLPYVLMHMRGTPQTMQSMTHYSDVHAAVMEFFEKKINECHSMGIDQLMLDPGFGFAKTIPQNFQWMRHLGKLQQFKQPVMVGLSRKSMIYKTLNTDPLMALNGSTAMHMYALMQGANLLRVHDVRPAWETIQLFLATQTS